jgi:hypothetical protein
MIKNKMSMNSRMTRGLSVCCLVDETLSRGDEEKNERK